MRPFGYIYMVTHRESGRFYVGQTRYTVQHRWNVHKSAAKRRPNTYFYKAIAAHGPSAFDVQEMATADNQEQLNTLETVWIIATGATIRGRGYNGNYGGASYVRNAESIARMRASLTGRKLTLEHRAAMSATLRGRKQSAAHRAARSLSLKGKQKPTDACRAAVAAANRTRVHSESTRAKLSAAAQKANKVRWSKPRQTSN